MGAHGCHFRREDAGGTIQRGKRLIEHRHVPADRGLTLDHVDLLAGIRQRQSRVNAGDAPAHHQHAGIDVNSSLLQWFVQGNTPHCGAHKILGLFRRRLFV